jgi:hypothetical protein
VPSTGISEYLFWNIDCCPSSIPSDIARFPVCKVKLAIDSRALLVATFYIGLSKTLSAILFVLFFAASINFLVLAFFIAAVPIPLAIALAPIVLFTIFPV